MFKQQNQRDIFINKTEINRDAENNLVMKYST